MNEVAKIICLTPIKNESWILKNFLESTSLWADHIIIADQGSDDGSLEIAKMFPKVILVKNLSKNYGEEERQKILINEARKIAGNKILIALDADEALTANAVSDKEWEIIKNLNQGTVIKFEWANVLPEKNVYWSSHYKMPFGFVDDGSEHTGKTIHSPRVPIPKNKIEYFPKNIKVMHFQYANWQRMESKHRWYQCWEIIKTPKRSSISIYRQYHHMYSVRKTEFKSIPNEWFEQYRIQGIDYENLPSEIFYYWDYEIISLFNQYGLKFFSKIDIWDVDWAEVSKNCKNNTLSSFNNPRTKFERLIIKYLSKTQPYTKNIILKIIDRLLGIFL